MRSPSAEALRWDLRAPLTVVNMLPLQCRCSFTHPDTLKKTLTGAIEPGAAHPVIRARRYHQLYVFFSRYPVTVQVAFGSSPVHQSTILTYI
jgi:hypothetical protein